MLFNSFVFLGLLLIAFVLYYIPKLRRVQVPILVLASLIFYSYDQFHFVLLLLGSAGINIFTSYFVVYGKAKRKKTLALSGITANLLLLAFFKYSPLVSITFFGPDESVGRFLLQIPLPIGVSFFTFEGISLLIDVWKEKYTDNKNIVPRSLKKHAQHTLFFISFFPHLIAGPILKAHDFFPQIREKYFKDINWESAFKNLIIGYFLKMVVADNLKDFTSWIQYPEFEMLSSLTLLIVLFGYSFQIFADFAGYSLIAIGLAKLFGYNFNDNFNFPYISASFKEFWKRWHISLSTFLMEYLYFPLGGNKKGKARTYLNLIITMTLGGLWHGAAWSYAIWGLSHGVFLAVERFITNNSPIKHKRISKLIHGLFVFFTVTFLWLLFKLPDFNDVVHYFNALFNNVGKYNNFHLISYILVYSSPVILYHLAYLSKDTPIGRVLKNKEYILYAIMLFFIVTNAGTAGSFIYFQF